MWCDNFDLDLYNLMPESREILKPAGAIKLWTHGRPDPRDGKINHPATWRSGSFGFVSLFSFSQSGFKPDIYVSAKPLISCTAAEALRDVWAHSLTMLVEGCPVWIAPKWREHFDIMMRHARRWRTSPPDELRRTRKEVLAGLRAAVKDLLQLQEIERIRLERANAAGSDNSGADGLAARADQAAG